jgi:hypothetical protein
VIGLVHSYLDHWMLRLFVVPCKRDFYGPPRSLDVRGHALHAKPVLALHAVEEIQDGEGLHADAAVELGQI